MRRRGGMWTAALMILVPLAACAGEPEDTMDEAEMTETPEAPAGEMGDVALACEPMTGQMELEGRLSPYDSARVQVGGQEALVCYGRPSLRGREMIGGENVPYGELWRTGANEPTTLHLPFAATVAGVQVQPGSYSLYTIPGESEWTIILNESTDQWGHESSYTPEVEAQEVGRGTVPVQEADETVETLTFTSEPAGGDTTHLVLEWEDTRVEIPVVAQGGG